MKFKLSFLLIMTLMVLFSLGTVVASEDSNFYMSDSDDLDLDMGLIDGSSILNENLNEESAIIQEDYNIKSSSDEEEDVVDLSVNMDVNVSYTDEEYNQVGSEVPWTVTVSVSNGTAHNTKVREVLSNNLEYLSYTSTQGSYDPSSGIWDVGDLSSSNNASLTIITKLKRAGTYLNKAYAKTDSNENDLLNNFIFLSIKTGSSKITSNITETTDDRNGPQHRIHYASMYNFDFDELEDDEFDDEESDSGDESDDGFGDDGGNDRDDGNSSSSSIRLRSSRNGFSKFFNPLSNSIDEIFNSSVDLNASSDTRKVFNMDFIVPPYDYTKIPILIFSLFVLVLLGYVAYDKVKS